MEKDSSYGIPGPWRQSLGSSDLLTDGKSWGPYNTGPLSQPHHTVMPFAHHFNDFLFCFTICNLLHVLVTSIYLFCCCLLPWMPLWALIPSTGSPKRFFFFFFPWARASFQRITVSATLYSDLLPSWVLFSPTLAAKPHSFHFLGQAEWKKLLLIGERMSCWQAQWCLSLWSASSRFELWL